VSSHAWPPECEVCGRSIADRAVDAKTCSNAHRQKLHRRNKRQREEDERRREGDS
jgi:predicted nucleic acid-binding Zn ribbon protein